MRYSQLFPKTRKEAPKDEIAVNAKLLIRAGFIDKLMAGSYTLLPLGLRVVSKINTIIREEINATGAQELLMPLLHPKNIWNETGRWESAKQIMYQFEKDDKEYALSFTHEEIVMDLLRKHVVSYKDLPVKIYHFSTKFRNELRAKSGVLREREFVMKDLYSAHRNETEMMEYYWQVAESYMRAFLRMGFEPVITEASGGVFTDKHTHEFQVICEAGEDTIYFSKNWKFAKNDEVMNDEDRKISDLYTNKSIEVGNIFPLGTMYAQKMGAFFTDQDGSKKPLWLSSYGIGPKRVMGTIVEVSHDDKGIKWPLSVAPYQVHLIGIMNQVRIKGKAEALYKRLTSEKIEVLYDDREDVGVGQKLADCDLIGIPFRVVVSERTGDNVELKNRWEEKTELLSVDELIKLVQSHLSDFDRKALAKLQK